MRRYSAWQEENYSLRAVPCLGAFEGALRMQNKAKRGTSTSVHKYRYTLLISIFRFFIQPMSSKLGSGDF